MEEYGSDVCVYNTLAPKTAITPSVSPFIILADGLAHTPHIQDYCLYDFISANEYYI